MSAARAASRFGRLSDEALLRALAAGQLEALGELYRRYAPSLQAHARRLGLNDPAGAVLSAFEEVFRLSPCFARAAVPARSWLLLLADRQLRAASKAQTPATSPVPPGGLPAPSS